MKRTYLTPVAEKVQFRYAEQITASTTVTDPTAPTDPTTPGDQIRDYLLTAFLGDCSSFSCNSLMSIFG